MNSLYQIMYPGAYLPWCTVIVYNIFHRQFFHLVSCLVFVGTAALQLSHIEHLEYDVMFWHRLFQSAELSLILRLVVYNQLGASWLGTFIMCALLCVRLSDDQHDFLMQAPIYSLCLLFLMSTSTMYLQQAACVALIAIAMRLSRKEYAYISHETSQAALHEYFILKIASVYFVFVLEWCSSNLHPASLPIILGLSFAFQAYVYLTHFEIDDNDGEMNSVYFSLSKLPKNYPFPLDFKHARENCKIANRVFKAHSI